MRDRVLTQYMQAGFPHLKQVAKLPEGLIPDFADVARTLGDEAMLEVAEPLGLSEKIKSFLTQAPDPSSLSAEVWQQGIANWRQVNYVLSVTMALLRACEKVDGLERRGALRVDSALVRGLGMIACSPFFPNGGDLLSRLADILGGTVAAPASLLERYVTALEAGDTDTLVAVDHCILENQSWREWAEKLVATGQGFPFHPRVIGISPELNDGLKQVLASMVMEVINADDSRNHPN